MNENPQDLYGAIMRLVNVLGGDCSPGLPVPQGENEDGGSLNFIVATPFAGALNPPAVAAATHAQGVRVPGFAVCMVGGVDSVSGKDSTRGFVRLYFTPPTENPNAYIRLSLGEWVRRRRGFNAFWITKDNVADTILPRLVVSRDPSFEALGTGQGCCDMGLLMQDKQDVSTVVFANNPTIAFANIGASTITVAVAGVYAIFASLNGAGFGQARIAVNGVGVAGTASERINNQGTAQENMAMQIASVALALGDIVSIQGKNTVAGVAWTTDTRELSIVGS